MAAPPKMTARESGTEAGVDWATVNAPLYGAVNGYVRVPDDHPWHGKGYDDIDVDAPGGLTFASGDWIGFDTLHGRDVWPDSPGYTRDSPYSVRWTPEMAADETRALARRVAEAARP